jgi:hypothetical protein
MSDSFGLNKSARNFELQLELLRSQTPPPLDPPFPYEPIPFPARLLRVNKWSDVVDEEDV